MNRKHLVEIIAALFILLFVYTAASKLLSLTAFQLVLRRSPLIGHWNILVSWAIPLTELGIAGMLLFPRTKLMGLRLSLLLMILFTAYLGYMLVFTPHLPCSCGGVIRYMSWRQHFLFNLFFIALAVTGLWLDRQRSGSHGHHTYYSARV